MATFDFADVASQDYYIDARSDQFSFCVALYEALARAPSETFRRAPTEDIIEARDLREHLLWAVGAHARNDTASDRTVPIPLAEEPRS